MKSMLTIAVSLLVLISGAAGQHYFMNPVIIGNEQGLFTDAVRDIQKDNKGFIWLATSNGIARYDGSQVKMYSLKKGPGNFGVNNVISIVAGDDKVWVGHTEGVSLMDPVTGEVSHLIPPGLEKLSVMRLKEDREGNIWVGTRGHGLWVINRTDRSFRKIELHEEEAPDIKPLLTGPRIILNIQFSPANDSTVWIGTQSGLARLNRYTGKVGWRVFHDDDNVYQVAVNAFRRLYIHDDGQIYVGSWTAGVNVFEPSTGKLRPLEVHDRKAREMLLNSAIGNITRNNERQIWITCGGGLILYDTHDKRAVQIWENDQVNEKFYGADFIDERGRIWHPNINGVRYFDPVISQFPVYTYDHLAGQNWAFSFYILPGSSDRELIVVPRNADAVYTLDRNTNSWSRKAIGRRLTVRGVRKYEHGLLMTSDEGIYIFRNNQLSVFNLRYRSKYNRFSDLVKGGNGEMWVNINGEGLFNWNTVTGRTRFFPRDQNIGSLFIDSRNNTWFATTTGIHVIDSGRSDISSFPVRIKYGFTEDRDGRIWMLLDGNEMGYIDRRKGVVYIFKTDEDISGQLIEHLVADSSGNIWGYNNNYFFRGNYSSGRLEKYSIDYGLNRPDFYHMSVLPSGEIVMGGRSKIMVIDPEKLRRNEELPMPYISGVEVLDRNRRKLFSGEQSLTLDHTEKNITIRFSAIAYTLGHKLKFRYKLDGLDEWTETSERREVNYTNLRGGDYLFQLQVANNEGIWNKEVISLPINILIPWWESTWFYILIGLVSVATVYLVYRYRVDDFRRKEKLRTEYEKKLAKVEMSALLAQMNPHFLFNSLNSIDSYIIKSESRKASEYLNNFARLIRRILYNSKSNLICLKDELETLDLYLQMESLRFKDRFGYEINVEDGIETSKIMIPPMLIQPYVENAIWHGIMHQDKRTRGCVTIDIRIVGEELHCNVRDNGIGRKKAMELAAQSQGPRRSSMGMQITSERIELINKLYNRSTRVEIIDLEDEQQHPLGTEVQLIISLT